MFLFFWLTIKVILPNKGNATFVMNNSIYDQTINKFLNEGNY